MTLIKEDLDRAMEMMCRPQGEPRFIMTRAQWEREGKPETVMGVRVVVIDTPSLR